MTQPSLLIQTARLSIRNLQITDVQGYFAVFGDPAIAALDDFTPISLQEAQEHLQHVTQALDEQQSEHEWAIVFRGALIGVLTLRSDALRGDAQWLGYHLCAQCHGQGFASEAVQAFVPAYVALTGRQICAAIDPRNAASARVLEKCGFECLGPCQVRDAHGKSVTEIHFRWRD